MTDLIIVGDQAFTPEEWEAEQRRLEIKRRYDRKRAHDPRRRAYMRDYMRRYMRAYRARKAA